MYWNFGLFRKEKLFLTEWKKKSTSTSQLTVQSPEKSSKKEPSVGKPSKTQPKSGKPTGVDIILFVVVQPKRNFH